MNDSQTCFNLMRKILEQGIAGCKCGGSGYSNITKNCKELNCNKIKVCDVTMGIDAECPSPIPCPHCTPKREMLARLCWYDEPISSMSFPEYQEKMIAWESNPDLTVKTRGDEPEVVALMKEIGEWFWDECMDYIWNKCRHSYCTYTNIMLSGTDRLQAINSYLEEVVG